MKCPMCDCEKEMTKGELWMRANMPLVFSPHGVPVRGHFWMPSFKALRGQSVLPFQSESVWKLYAKREAFQCEACGAVVT